jgi:Fur family transcriptional regulator, zinc uptake regulator
MAHLHTHDADHRFAAARAVMEAAGEQWTDMRAAVYAAVSTAGAPLSAYDIAEAVSSAQGRRVAANSVYRILDLFVQHHVVKRIESRNAYIASAHPEADADCIFLVCDRCGNTDHIDNTQISADVRTAASRHGFIPVRPVIEVHGRCARCAA